ncbi:unnamed protein product [Gulo gulo]|uniref:Uncharacterized protein n=1 Tax=Gulo gulo TaxID=48420 RepID=A0A9X9LXH2_GULGU|nr:unnamed protein product [Gulo gulo]
MTSLGSCIPLRRFRRNVRCYDHPRNRLPVGTRSKAPAVNGHMDSSSTRNWFNQHACLQAPPFLVAVSA